MADIEEIIQAVRAKERGRGVVSPDHAAALVREIERLRAVEQTLRGQIRRAADALAESA